MKFLEAILMSLKKTFLVQWLKIYWGQTFVDHVPQPLPHPPSKYHPKSIVFYHTKPFCGGESSKSADEWLRIVRNAVIKPRHFQCQSLVYRKSNRPAMELIGHAIKEGTTFCPPFNDHLVWRDHHPARQYYKNNVLSFNTSIKTPSSFVQDTSLQANTSWPSFQTLVPLSWHVSSWLPKWYRPLGQVRDSTSSRMSARLWYSIFITTVAASITPLSRDCE